MDARLLQRLSHCLEVLQFGIHLDQVVSEHDVLGSCLHRDLKESVLIYPVGRNPDVSLAVELPGDSARVGQRSTLPGDDTADVGDGTILVVGDHLQQQSDPIRGIPLVRHLGQLFPFEFPGAALDGPFDVVLGHVGGLGLVHGQA